MRDKIPDIIRENNKEPYTHVASENEFKLLVLSKLTEELEEFKANPNEEELADLLEVIEGMATAFHLDINKILELKAKKKQRRGGFKDRIVLEKVVE